MMFAMADTTNGAARSLNGLRIGDTVEYAYAGSVRRQRIAELQRRIAAGTYRVSAEQIADRMIARGHVMTFMLPDDSGAADC